MWIFSFNYVFLLFPLLLSNLTSDTLGHSLMWTIAIIPEVVFLSFIFYLQSIPHVIYALPTSSVPSQTTVLYNGPMKLLCVFWAPSANFVTVLLHDNNSSFSLLKWPCLPEKKKKNLTCPSNFILKFPLQNCLNLPRIGWSLFASVGSRTNTVAADVTLCCNNLVLCLFPLRSWKFLEARTSYLALYP